MIMVFKQMTKMPLNEREMAEKEKWDKKRKENQKNKIKILKRTSIREE